MKQALKLTAILLFAMMVSVVAPKVADAATPKKTKITKIEANASQIRLTWSKKSGITGYKIYQSTDKKKYKLVKTIKKASTTTYTKKSLTFNKKYYYKVKTYKGKKTSAFSNTASIKTQLTKPKIETYGIYNSIYVGWSNVLGKTKYEVYRSTVSNSGFKKVMTVSGNDMAEYCLEFDKTYYYKVRAYKTYKGKTYYGPYSSVKSAKTDTMGQTVNDLLPLSRKYIIEWLTDSGVSEGTATTFVDGLGIDWNEQAVELARIFLEWYPETTREEMQENLAEILFEQSEIDYALNILY